METQEYKEKYGTCVACANSPVNHRIAYITQTLNIIAGNFWFSLAQYRLTAIVSRWFRKLAVYGNRSHYYLARAMRIASFGTDVTRANSYRSQVVWEEALLRNIIMEQVYVFGKPIDMYRAKLRGGWFYFESLPVPPELPHEAYGWFDDKFLLKQVLKDAGVPVSKAVSLTSEAELSGAYNSLSAPLIAKPQIGSRGRHTSTHLYKREDVLQAFIIAQQLCKYVVIEEHLEGPVCRATVVGGKLAGFLKATAPSVTGDGVKTIEELIQEKNAARPARVGEILMTDEYRAFISRSGYTTHSIPEAGKTIMLTQRTGRLYGGATYEMPNEIHPKLRTYVEKAASILNVPIVGFDLIIEDPTIDPDTVKWGIIEANSLPFIDLHYLPLFGAPSHVAKNLWDLWGNVATS